MITILKKLLTGASSAQIVPQDDRVTIYATNSKIYVSHRISLDITSLFSDVPPQPVCFRKAECVALKKALNKGSEFSMINGQLAVDSIPVLFTDDQFDLSAIYDGTETDSLVITPSMASEVKAAAEHSAKHNSHRSTITGVYFDFDQNHIAATNGHSAFIAPLESEKSGSFMLDPVVASGLIRAKYHLSWNESAYLLVYPDGRRHEQKIERHTFPITQDFLSPILSREEVTLRFYAKPLVDAYLTAFDRDEILTLRKDNDILSFAIGSAVYKKFRISSEGNFVLNVNTKLIGKDPTGVWGIVPNKTQDDCTFSPITIKSVGKTLIVMPYNK